jgi:hypothetical protein
LIFKDLRSLTFYENGTLSERRAFEWKNFTNPL